MLLTRSYVFSRPPFIRVDLMMVQNFSSNQISFWHSTGADPLVKTAGPFSGSTSSNGADWHLGVLRLPRSGNDGTGAEDWYFSGTYIESGTLTTSVASPK
jgi:hypothetical protein